MPKGIPGSIADHGTATRYMRNCRCDACLQAGRAYFNDRNHRIYGRKPMAEHLASIEPAHGTESRYTSRKCRCDACRTAANEARRRRRNSNPEAANAYDRDYKWLNRYG